MTGGLLDRLIARADAELSRLEQEPSAPDQALRLAELRERRRRLQELREDGLRHPRGRPAEVPGRAAG